MAKTEIILNIEGLFEVPDFLFQKLKADLHSNLISLIEQTRLD